MGPCLRVFVNNKAADQPAHTRSLISAFVIRLWKNILSGHASSDCSSFQLVPVAEKTGLSIALSETPKTVFLATRPNVQSSEQIEKLLKKVKDFCVSLKVLLTQTASI